MLVRLLFTLLAILTLSSCIEGDEELWLNRDGSGRIEATYRMPPTLMNRFGGATSLQERLIAAIEKEPGIRIEHISHHIEGAQVVFELRADFDDAISFIELPSKHFRDPETPDKPATLESFFGEMDLKLTGLSLEFHRNIDLSPILPLSVQENGALLGDSAFNYTLHLPTKPSTHNATSVSDEGTTLHWSFPLKDHVKTPMHLHATLFLPLPWWLWTALALLILLLPYALLRLIKRRKRRALPPADQPPAAT